MSLVAGNRLRLLGHSLPIGATNVGDAPSLATTVPGFEFAGWIGLLAPKGLPSALSVALAEAVQKALQARDILHAFEANGAVPAASNSIEFRRFLEKDIATNKKAIALAGIQAE
jgi:tripartite-type tricarboxylate transporter receptor subunit TctC